MANMSRLNIKLPTNYAISINRNATSNDKLVYVAVSNKHIKYPNGSSKIVYIGTTKNGAYRIAISAAQRAYDKLYDHGTNSLFFYVVTCTPRNGVKTWHKLERALLIRFREIFDSPPQLNLHGIKMKWTNERDLFTLSRLDAVIKYYSDISPE